MPIRLLLAVAWIALAALSCVTLSASDPIPAHAPPPPPAIDETLPAPRAKESTAPAVRIREGSQVVDLVGTFKLNGDRLSFSTSSGEHRFETLENITLERVARTMKESRDIGEWRVSGTVTEYLGTNFLLVTRAIIKAKGQVEHRPRQ